MRGPQRFRQLNSFTHKFPKMHQTQYFNRNSIDENLLYLEFLTKCSKITITWERLTIEFLSSNNFTLFIQE